VLSESDKFKPTSFIFFKDHRYEIDLIHEHVHTWCTTDKKYRPVTDEERYSLYITNGNNSIPFPWKDVTKYFATAEEYRKLKIKNFLNHS
jgi:hypothetical protein